MRFRIATRASALAQWQARQIMAGLEACGHASEMVLVSTEGDRRVDLPLRVIGGKGVFVKEVQAAVLRGEADVAVHSAKDLPAVTPDGLVIAAALERADPRDCLVGSRLADLADGATVATGAPRRRAQLAARRPDLNLVELRGNIDTRLARLEGDGVDAVVVAAAALDRLGRTPAVVDHLPVGVMVPQAGQGVVVAECRADDAMARHVLDQLDHAPTRVVLTAERSVLEHLGGDCDLPVGAHAVLDSPTRISMSGVLFTDGEERRASVQGSDPRRCGAELVEQLLRQP